MFIIDDTQFKYVQYYRLVYVDNGSEVCYFDFFQTYVVSVDVRVLQTNLYIIHVCVQGVYDTYTKTGKCIMCTI